MICILFKLRNLLFIQPWLTPMPDNPRKWHSGEFGAILLRCGLWSAIWWIWMAILTWLTGKAMKYTFTIIRMCQCKYTCRCKIQVQGCTFPTRYCNETSFKHTRLNTNCALSVVMQISALFFHLPTTYASVGFYCRISFFWYSVKMTLPWHYRKYI